MDGPIHVCCQKLPSQLFPICLISAVMLNFDMEVKRAFAPVEPLARLVWAHKAPIDFPRGPPKVFLPPVFVLDSSFICTVVVIVFIIIFLLFFPR